MAIKILNAAGKAVVEIETHGMGSAPKDGTEVLLQTDVGLITGWFHIEDGVWVCMDDMLTIEEDSGILQGWAEIAFGPNEENVAPPLLNEGETRSGKPGEKTERRKIVIRKTPTADSRTCDYTQVTKEQLLRSSQQHLKDVANGFEFLQDMMKEQAAAHDRDKITDIEGFYRNFITGFEQKDWLENHYKTNRHHLLLSSTVPEDVNLIDVLDFVVDRVVAGMGRSMKVADVELDPVILAAAVHNTIRLLTKNVVLVD